jgi:uncharacterized protein YdeI (YjbR/CyaY-like superfamily)
MTAYDPRDPTTAPDGREIVHPKTRKEWRAWLAKHHVRPEGVWVASYRTGTGKPRVEYDEIVEEALAFGWIDSRAKTLDDERSLLWLAPRRRTSGWSKSNKERLARLERQGVMTDAGRRVVEEAKASGAWTLLDAVEALEVPADLAEALSSNEAAQRYFDAFPASSKKIILTWIATAKRDETRKRRILETVRLAAENKRANHRP